MAEMAFWHLVIAGTLIVFMVYRYLQRQAALETYRDRIQMVREGLFDLALDERASLDFAQPVYREFESTLFYLLETAERLSMVYLAVILLRKDLKGSPFHESLLKQIPDAYTRDRAVELWRRINLYLHNYYCSMSIVYLFWTSGRARFQPAQSDPVTDRVPRYMGHITA